MQIELESKPSYGMAVVTLDAGETITAESGSMVAMTTQVAVDTRFNGTGSGGILDFLQAALVGLARKFLAGETMFVNTFTPNSEPSYSPSSICVWKSFGCGHFC